MKSEKYLSMAKDIRSKVEDLLDEYYNWQNEKYKFSKRKV